MNGQENNVENSLMGTYLKHRSKAGRYRERERESGGRRDVGKGKCDITQRFVASAYDSFRRRSLGY